MTTKPQSVWDLPRNDIEACRQFLATNSVTPDQWRTMLRLQDDPDKLIAAAKTWKRDEPAAADDQEEDDEYEDD